ncbi:Cytochrome B6 [Vibrio chagasii]|nr:Cytochrome B6 [Vibrio chagasii]CAH6889075.1 Cytochrome B6 [Vibrio chagasii]CAH6889772.1 Cytochrome B6 [Vibrio chagasii]CAH6902293.1 Cytochrome B6 [Vibrio chagasii]CAH6936689.1 Cytochrome B6 [Vibrio chagasii]
MERKVRTTVLCLIISLGFWASFTGAHDHNDVKRSLIPPIKKEPNVDIAMARIGWHLFRDPNLSSNGMVSCESCHNLQTNGATESALAEGVKGKGTRNPPTIFNVSLNYRFLWDASKNSLIKQIDGPLTSPTGMDSNWPAVQAYVRSDPGYQALFRQADNLQIETYNIKLAIVEFLHGLQTPSAPFDKYLQGDTGAIDERAEQGWLVFQEVGCVQCHQGKNVGGSMVQQFDYFKEAGADKGRFLRTEDGIDEYFFRVTSLRNVTKTAPYFHNGRTESLQAAIQIMAESELGKRLSHRQTADIEAFLHTLTAPRPSILERFENE